MNLIRLSESITRLYELLKRSVREIDSEDEIIDAAIVEIRDCRSTLDEQKRDISRLEDAVKSLTKELEEYRTQKRLDYDRKFRGCPPIEAVQHIAVADRTAQDEGKKLVGLDTVGYVCVQLVRDHLVNCCSCRDDYHRVRGNVNDGYVSRIEELHATLPTTTTTEPDQLAIDAKKRCEIAEAERDKLYVELDLMKSKLRSLLEYGGKSF